MSKGTADEKSNDGDSEEETVTFGQPPSEEFGLPPRDEVDEEDVASVSLRGEGDWMHPSEDDEGSGYIDPSEISQEERDRDLVELYYEDDGEVSVEEMTDEEIAREAERIRTERQRDERSAQPAQD